MINIKHFIYYLFLICHFFEYTKSCDQLIKLSNLIGQYKNQGMQHHHIVMFATRQVLTMGCGSLGTRLSFGLSFGICLIFVRSYTYLTKTKQISNNSVTITRSSNQLGEYLGGTVLLDNYKVNQLGEYLGGTST